MAEILPSFRKEPPPSRLRRRNHFPPPLPGFEPGPYTTAPSTPFPPPQVTITVTITPATPFADSAPKPPHHAFQRTINHNHSTATTRTHQQ